MYFAHLAGRAVHTATGRAGAVQDPGFLLLHRACAEPGRTIFGPTCTELLLDSEMDCAVLSHYYSSSVTLRQPPLDSEMGCTVPSCYYYYSSVTFRGSPLYFEMGCTAPSYYYYYSSVMLRGPLL